MEHLALARTDSEEKPDTVLELMEVLRDAKEVACLAALATARLFSEDVVALRAALNVCRMVLEERVARMAERSVTKVAVAADTTGSIEASRLARVVEVAARWAASTPSWDTSADCAVLMLLGRVVVRAVDAAAMRGGSALSEADIVDTAGAARASSTVT